MYLICLKSSHKFGMGHLFRMINLFKLLKSNNIESVIILLNSDSNSEKWLSNNDISYEISDENEIDWEINLINKYQPSIWINDRLNTDYSHVQIVSNYKIPVVTFDDYGSGAEISEVNFCALNLNAKEQVKGKNVLIGLDYLILNQELKDLKRIRKNKSNFAVTLGGSDTYGMTIFTLKYILDENITATIFLGPNFSHNNELYSLVTDRIEIKKSVDSLHKELYNYDYAITGGGITAFECAAVGLPTFTIANEKHEVGYCQYLEKKGCSIYGGFRDKSQFSKLSSIDNIQNMSLNGMREITVEGVINVFDKISKIETV